MLTQWLPSEFVQRLPDDRYLAIEIVRILLKFKRSEWKILLQALARTDNGWFEFMLGSVSIKFLKIVDIDEIKIEIEQGGHCKTTKTATYTFDLKDFIDTKRHTN